MRWLGLALALLASPALAEPAALSRLYAPLSLLAGCSEEGYRDGGFLRAKFDAPQGLAYRADGDRVYVADSGNDRVRELGLGAQPRVVTVLGPADGIKAPTQLLWLGSTLLLLQADGALKAFSEAEGAWTPLPGWRAPRGGAAWMGPASGGRALVLSRKGDAYLYNGQDGKRGDYPLPSGFKDGRLGSATWGALAWDPVGGRAWQRVEAGLPGKDPKAVWKDLAGDFKGLEASCVREDGLDDAGILLWSPAVNAFFSVDAKGAVAKHGVPMADGVLSGYADASHPLPGPLGLAYRGPARSILIADTGSHRLLEMQDHDLDALMNPEKGNLQGVMDYQNPPDKPVDEKRVLVVGSSMAFFHKTREATYPKRLQWELNLGAALRGETAHWRVGARAVIGSAMGGGAFSLFSNAPTDLDAWKPDWVLIEALDLTLAMEVLAFGRTAVQDDVAVNYVDPETAVLPLSQRPLGDNAKAILGWAKEHPDQVKDLLRVDANGEQHLDAFAPVDQYRAIFAAPEVQAAARAILRKNIVKAKARAQQMGTRLAVLVLPTRQDIALGELTGSKTIFYETSLGPCLPLMDWAAEAAQAEGVTVFDLRPAMRLAQPELFALFKPEDLHLQDSGAAWVGRVLAAQLLAADSDAQGSAK